MKVIGYVVLGILGYFVLGYTLVILNIVALPLFTLQTKVTQNARIIEKTYNAENQIYNYHWFKEREAQIETTKKQVSIAKVSLDNFETSAGPRVNWTFEDKTEDSRLRSVWQGLQNHYEEIVNEYNARAKEVDRAIFQDGLKTFIPLD